MNLDLIGIKILNKEKQKAHVKEQKMMTSEELKSQIAHMEKQVDNLEHQLFEMRAELAKRVFDMDTVDIVAMANRMNDLEERIEVGKQKVVMAKRILG